jgi:hypothetical protein
LVTLGRSAILGRWDLSGTITESNARHIGYEEELRVRVEAVCFRRELAFAEKLPNGEQVRERAEKMLELCASRDYWANTAFDDRYVQGVIEAARHVGLPAWLARAALALRALRLGVSRHIRRRTRP